MSCKMASFPVAQASPRVLAPSLRSSLPRLLPLSQPKTRILKNPAPNNQLISRAMSRENISIPLLRSNIIKTKIASMSTTTSPVTKDDKISDDIPNEKVGDHHEASLSLIDYLPTKFQPYARLARVDKPIGSWLFILPFAWSVSLAASTGSLPDLKTLALFCCAAPLLRGAGCTINDFFDRDLDAKVERTKQRPIASGAVTPFQALCFYVFQLLLSHLILLQLPNYSLMHEISFIFLFSTYPLMKRITYWPQAYLGLTFNWGAYYGWYAIKGSLQPSIVLPLFVAGIFWTLVYDTIYAHQDKKDDVKVGIKSTALKLADSTKEWTTGFALVCISSLALSGYNAAIGWPYYVFLAAASGQLAWQIGTADLSSPADCGRKFVSNKWFGALVFCGILLGRLFP